MQKSSSEKSSFLDTPMRLLFNLNWETAFYILLIVLALTTRFWDLGARAFSHDESWHGNWSWKLYAGQGYRHDPASHGPFLFEANALIHLLFGVNDYTARMVPALFGVILVALPYLFRKWLGRTGALITSVLFLISPSLLFYSRYIRNDVYIVVWTLLLIFAMFRYLEERKSFHLYLLVVILSLSFCTKENTFIFGFILGSFLGLLFLVQWLGDRQRAIKSFPAFELALVMGTLVLPLLTAFPVKLLLGADPLDYSQAGIVRSVATFLTLLAISAIVGLWWDWRRWLISAGLFYSIYIVLYTTFFTNGQGFATGLVGSLGYWLAQHGVQRGSQPWFYYFVLMPMYEFVPLIFSLMGIGYELQTSKFKIQSSKSKDQSLGFEVESLRFFIYWLITSLVIYSWAGEKMPWLILHVVLPMIVLAGHFVGEVFERIDWRAIWRGGGPILALLLILALFAASALVTAAPFQGRSLAQLSRTLQWLAALVVGAILVVSLVRYWRGLGTERSLQVVFVTAFVLLSILTVRFSWMASYINYDTAKEFIVYAHGTPDITLTMKEIEDISRRTVGDKQIKVAYDNESTWPFEWYLQEYPNLAYYGAQPSKQALDAPIVLVGPPNDSKVRPFLGDNYYWFERRLIWWPMEEYKNWTPGKIMAILRDPAQRREWWNIFWYRKYPRSTDDWYYKDPFYFCVRKDVINQLWDYGVGPAPIELVEDPYEKGKREVTAMLTWGSQGKGNGQFQDPRGIAVDEAGNVYVADSGNHRIQKFDSNGQFLTQWGSEGDGPGQFKEPWGIAVDAEGHVYVADTWNHRIQKFDAEGNFLRQWGSFRDTGGAAVGDGGFFWGPRDIGIDAAGNVYVTDTGNKRVQVFGPDGQFLDQWGGFGVEDGLMDEPVGVAIDEEGNIYVADTWNQRVQKFDQDLKFVTAWPINGWYGQSVVNKPYLAAAEGRVYVTDPEGYRVLVFDQGGEFVATFGEYGFDSKSFSLPTGIAVDGDGNVYVIDSANHRVMKFAPMD
ncbi:MAG: flippase activity-associated protein Agl23 [Anaerolineae bacterium]